MSKGKIKTYFKQMEAAAPPKPPRSSPRRSWRSRSRARAKSSGRPAAENCSAVSARRISPGLGCKKFTTDLFPKKLSPKIQANSHQVLAIKQMATSSHTQDPFWKTWFHLQRPSGRFHVSLREGIFFAGLVENKGTPPQKTKGELFLGKWDAGRRLWRALGPTPGRRPLLSEGIYWRT